jgi:hypothetical protein
MPPPALRLGRRLAQLPYVQRYTSRGPQDRGEGPAFREGLTRQTTQAPALSSGLNSTSASTTRLTSSASVESATCRTTRSGRRHPERRTSLVVTASAAELTMRRSRPTLSPGRVGVSGVPRSGEELDQERSGVRRVHALIGRRGVARQGVHVRRVADDVVAEEGGATRVAEAGAPALPRSGRLGSGSSRCVRTERTSDHVSLVAPAKSCMSCEGWT